MVGRFINGLSNRFLARGANAAGESAEQSRALLRRPSWRTALTGTLMFGDVYMNMKQGDDFGTALVKSAATTAMFAMFPVATTVAYMAPVGYEVSKAGYEWWRAKEAEYQRMYQKGTLGGGYVDTQQAITMRQAAVQAIQGSKLNARSALGGEAKILAAGWFKG